MPFLTKALFFFFLVNNLCYAKIVEYDLTIDYKIINFTGKEVSGMTINGDIPAQTLYFEIRDIAQISITNNMDKETSVHWHGILSGLFLLRVRSGIINERV